ncbi:hypothetical protein GW17_00024959 [Ensete ventricosum]|nr:hypothetical protein GW17_00024959 [Ensete ventricosum]
MGHDYMCCIATNYSTTIRCTMSPPGDISIAYRFSCDEFGLRLLHFRRPPSPLDYSVLLNNLCLVLPPQMHLLDCDSSPIQFPLHPSRKRPISKPTVPETPDLASISHQTTESRSFSETPITIKAIDEENPKSALYTPFGTPSTEGGGREEATDGVREENRERPLSLSLLLFRFASARDAAKGQPCVLKTSATPRLIPHLSGGLRPVKSHEENKKEKKNKFDDKTITNIEENMNARTADLIQVRSAPPTCKRTSHCKESEHGGRVRRYDKP